MRNIALPYTLRRAKLCLCAATSAVYRLLIYTISAISKMKYDTRNVRENESWWTPIIAIRTQNNVTATPRRNTIVPSIIPTKRENSFFEAKFTDQYPAAVYNTASTNAYITPLISGESPKRLPVTMSLARKEINCLLCPSSVCSL